MAGLSVAETTQYIYLFGLYICVICLCIFYQLKFIIDPTKSLLQLLRRQLRLYVQLVLP